MPRDRSYSIVIDLVICSIYLNLEQKAQLMAFADLYLI